MKTLKLLLIVFTDVWMLRAQGDVHYVPETDPLVAARIEEWRGLKFGLLMHWGPYSQWGVVESWSICAEDEDWCRRNSQDYSQYKKDYENLRKTFNPVKFDPDRWAKAAKRAGMRYVVFTTKHHDGFSMFDTKLSDYKITASDVPFSTNSRANITKEVFTAFRNHEMWVGAYFSKPDWHSEYYWWPNFATPDRNVNYEIARYPQRWEKFVQFAHGQLEELVAGYGRVDILWLDGGWVRTRSEEELRTDRLNPEYRFQRLQSQDIRMDELVAKVRARQPGIIVVDRAVPGKNQNYLTPENTVPPDVILDPWESCIIAGGGWSWTPNARYMRAGKVITMLVDIVAKGGNLLLNIAPGPDGAWDEGAYALLDSVGSWMTAHKEAIYNTRPVSPHIRGDLRFTDRDGKALYVLVGTGEGVSDPPARIHLEPAEVPDGSTLTILGSSLTPSVVRLNDRIEVSLPQNFKPSLEWNPVWVLKITRPVSPRR